MGRWSQLAACSGALLVAAASACTPFAAEAERPDAGSSDAGSSDTGSSGGANTPDADAKTLAAYRSAVLADSPVAYFPLDDKNPGPGGMIREEISKRLLGEVHGTPAFEVEGAIEDGKGISFQTGDWIVLEDKWGFDGTKSFTIEVWLQFRGGGAQHIFTKQDRGAVKQGYALLYIADELNIERFVNGAKKYSAKGIDPAFHHVAATYDGTKLRLYRDGAEVGGGDDMDSRTLPLHQVPAIIGAADIGGAYSLDGTLDELAIYDKALTPAQLSAHFKAR